METDTDIEQYTIIDKCNINLVSLHVSIKTSFLKDHEYPLSELFWYSPKENITKTAFNCCVIYIADIVDSILDLVFVCYYP